jgi:hypothetical protein
MIIENYTNSAGQEMVLIDNQNETLTCMTKEAYEAQQVAQSTLASELSNPSTPQAGA